MGAILSAYFLNPSLRPKILHASSYPSIPPSHPPFKFAICVGGFLPKPSTPDLSGFFPIGADTYTLHVVGKLDHIVAPERGKELARSCDDSRLEMHEGCKSIVSAFSLKRSKLSLTCAIHLLSAHFVPSKIQFRHFFKAWIESFLEGGCKGDVSPPAAATPAGDGARTRETTPETFVPDGKGRL